MCINVKFNFTASANIPTGNDYIYHDSGLVVTGVNSISFDVSAKNDAHVALSISNIDGSTSGQDKDVYEIVIGGWGDSQSVIRKSKQGSNLCTASTPDIVENGEYRPFWISWENGLFSFGKGHTVGSNKVCDWQDNNPRAVNYVSVATGWGSEGDWSFQSGECQNRLV